MPSPANPCDDIVEACHDVDPGAGPVHACHELGHEGEVSACLAERDRCIALCAEAARQDAGPRLDAGVAHHDAAHEHEEDAAVADAPLERADAALDEDGSTASDGGPTTRAYTLRFAARAGDAPVSCAAPITGIGLGGAQSADLVDFRFYVHGIELLTAGGEAVPFEIDDELPWQNRGVALLDFENGTGRCTGTTETRDLVRGRAREGAYVGVRFVLGVPFEQNHQDASAAAPPLNLTALFWNWQGGYKFARIDVSSELPGMSGARAAFNVHLGSTGCDGSPAGGVTMCMRPNRPVIELAGFDPDRSVVVVDYAAMVEGVDLTFNTPMTAAGCMSGPMDPECAEVFASFGLPFGTDPGGSQDVFRVGMP